MSIIIRAPKLGEERVFTNDKEGFRQLIAYSKELKKKLAEIPEEIPSRDQKETQELNRVWSKFFEKVNAWEKLNYLEWTEYHFLGFLQSKIQFPIKPLKCNPSRHPTLLRIKTLIGRINGHKQFPARFSKEHRQRMMEFLTWCFVTDSNIKELNDIFSLMGPWLALNPAVYISW